MSTTNSSVDALDRVLSVRMHEPFEAGVESDALNHSALRMAAKKTLEVDQVDTSLVYSLESLVSFSQDVNRPELGSVYRNTIAAWRFCS